MPVDVVSYDVVAELEESDRDLTTVRGHMRPPVDDEIKTAVLAVIDSRQYILGAECRAFEQEFASYIGSTHAANDDVAGRSRCPWPLPRV